MKLTKEFKIGIVVVLAIAAFVWGVSFLKGSNLFSRKFYLYAVYPKIEGLIPANPIQVNGFKIGQVKKISLLQNDTGNAVLVQMLITEDVNIPKGSIARAASADLLGGWAINIIFNDSTVYFKSGDTLKTETEAGLKESFNKQLAPLQAKAESVISSIDSVMTVVSLVLNTRTRDNIDRSFESVRKAIFSLEQTAYKLDGIMEPGGKLDGILTNLNSISHDLAKDKHKINNIITNFSNFSDTLAQSNLKGAIDKANNTLSELNVLMTRINQGQGTLGKLAKNDSLYTNLS